MSLYTAGRIQALACGVIPYEQSKRNIHITLRLEPKALYAVVL